MIALNYLTHAVAIGGLSAIKEKGSWKYELPAPFFVNMYASICLNVRRLNLN
jgi:hypothetical protein